MRQQINLSTAVDNNRVLSGAGLGCGKLGTPFFPSGFSDSFSVVPSIFAILRVKKRTEWRWGKNKKKWKYTLLGSVPFQAADGAFVPSAASCKVRCVPLLCYKASCEFCHCPYQTIYFEHEYCCKIFIKAFHLSCRSLRYLVCCEWVWGGAGSQTFVLCHWVFSGCSCMIEALSKMPIPCTESEPCSVKYFIYGLLENKEPIKIEHLLSSPSTKEAIQPQRCGIIVFSGVM